MIGDKAWWRKVALTFTGMLTFCLLILLAYIPIYADALQGTADVAREVGQIPYANFLCTIALVSLAGFVAMGAALIWLVYMGINKLGALVATKDIRDAETLEVLNELKTALLWCKNHSGKLDAEENART